MDHEEMMNELRAIQIYLDSGTPEHVEFARENLRELIIHLEA